MKKSQTIRDLLGFTQDELALILQVSRSQFANYESGTRNLPLAATQLLAEMLTYAQSPEMAEKKSPHLIKQQHKKQQQLGRLLKENEYQQLLMARKVTAAQKKYNSKLKVLQLVDFLIVRNTKTKTSGSSVLKTISNKASKALEREGLGALYTYELKQELLQLEKLLLDAALRKLTSNPDFVGSKE